MECRLWKRWCVVTLSASIDTVTRPGGTRPPLALSSVLARPRQDSFSHKVERRARGSNDPAPVQDDADVNDVNELINEIEAQVVDDSTHREQRVEINDPVVD